ncbi:MAG: hypothetical protein OEM59_21775 [Rhodospirillales bacterium]|nr:hypothetical protein [Rhodospirillales bacterium]
MMTEIYDALRTSGATEDQARAAAQLIAAYDARLSKIEAQLKVLQWLFIVVLSILLVSWFVPYFAI